MSQRAWLLVAALLLAVGGISLTTPLLHWGIEVGQAGRLLERGMEWPHPRQVDSLPIVQDPAALAQARAALAAAIRARPNHPHAYRLLGQSWLAEGSWEQAIAALTQARDRAPFNALIAWELGLAYEQQALAGRGDATLSLRLWQAVGFTGAAFTQRGAQADGYQRPTEALRWYRRAVRLDRAAAFPTIYAQLVQAQTHNLPTHGELLALAQAANPAFQPPTATQPTPLPAALWLTLPHTPPEQVTFWQATQTGEYRLELTLSSTEPLTVAVTINGHVQESMRLTPPTAQRTLRLWAGPGLQMVGLRAVDGPLPTIQQATIRPPTP